MMTTHTVTPEEARAIDRSLWSEGRFMAEVVALADRRGFLVYHTHDSRRSRKGYPDLTMVRGRRIVFAELKRQKGGRVGEDQRIWLDALRCAGAEVYLWTPAAWDAIEEVLR